MLAGDFARKLKKLNKHLHIYSSGDDRFAAGVYFYKGEGEYKEVCGVSKNYVPEYSVFTPQGLIKYGGWRRVLKILIKSGYCTKRDAEKVFRTHMDCKEPPKQKFIFNQRGADWEEAIRRGAEKAISKFGRPVENYVEVDDIIQIHRKYAGEKKQ